MVAVFESESKIAKGRQKSKERRRFLPLFCVFLACRRRFLAFLCNCRRAFGRWTAGFRAMISPATPTSWQPRILTWGHLFFAVLPSACFLLLVVACGLRHCRNQPPRPPPLRAALPLANSVHLQSQMLHATIVSAYERFVARAAMAFI
ncbi:hypothetical protein [Segatella baroniae]|nr:hypothetical protein [Segatella baroniae]